ncbi:MAG: TRAP transporter small permease subunit [Planctomycetaceae bacterium]|nr:TRAP transporter small permease subunit [Planctomycetaceae bacterium]
MAALKGLDRGVQAFLRSLCVALFIVLGLILMTNVVMRVMNDLSIWLDGHDWKSAAMTVKSLVPITSMHWFDEIVELCFAALVFYGAAALWAIKGHFSVGDWISARLPTSTLRALYKLAVSLMSLAFIAIFFYFSYSLTRRSTELSTVFQIPKSVMYSCMPISSGIMLAYSLVDVIQDGMALLGVGGAGSKEQASRSM